MRGEFLALWDSMWGEIWWELALDPLAPVDVFSELYRELASSLALKLEVGELADRSNDPTEAQSHFESTKPQDFAGERAVVSFLERAFDVLEESGDDGEALSNRYASLLDAFIEKYSLRYERRNPCKLCPTLPGVFASLTYDLQAATRQDPNLDSAMRDFELAVSDLSSDPSEVRIKTCIQKQMNLLEAIGQVHPGVSSKTLGKICDQVGTWPHANIRDAIKILYSFACDYPGIRHAGSPQSALRPIDMRDMIAVTIMLVGFTPYLTDRLDIDHTYRGA